MRKRLYKTKDQEAIMKKKQFDKFLGGFQSLPQGVSIMNFVSSRAHEISAMTSSIGMPQCLF